MDWVDFWEGPTPGPGSIEEVSAMEEQVDWGWEGEEDRIIWRAVGQSY
jgi:hypothetical protein